MRVNVRISTKQDLSNHGLINAKSGGGKSVFMTGLAQKLIEQSNGNRKHSVLIIDPHGDFGRSILALKIQDKSRLFYLSTAITREAKAGRNYTFCFNPFTSDNAEMDYLLTEILSNCISELLEEAAFSKQMERVLKPCIATVLRTASPNMATLNRFFLTGQADDLMQLGCTSDNPNHREFFQHEWNSENLRITKSSIRVKLSFFLSDPRLANILSGKSTFDLERAIDNGSVIILNIPKGSGSFTSKVLGKLMLAYVHAIMMKRDGVEEHLRKPLYVLVDEFTSIITASLGDSLAEARKYKMSCILACQTLGQISESSLKKTILVNTGLKVVGLTDYQDRMAFAREMGIDGKDLETLRPLEFYLKRNDGRHKAFKFKASILPRFYFISKKERQELFNWIVTESGHYKEVAAPPPAPPSPIPNSSKQTKKRSPDEPSEGLKPAF